MESNLKTPVNTFQAENHGSLSGLVYLAANCELPTAVLQDTRSICPLPICVPEKV